MSGSVPSEGQGDVVEAVRKALATHGYARLTTAKIAAESEMSEAGLYYHYDSKDEMVVAFLDAAVDFLAGELDEIDARDPETQLRAACDRLFVQHDEETRRGVNIAVMELLSHAPHNDTLREPLLELERNTLELLERIVSNGVDQGVFWAVDPRGVAAFLLAAANGSTGFYLALGMDDVGDPLREQVSAFVDSLLVEPPA